MTFNLSRHTLEISELEERITQLEAENARLRGINAEGLERATAALLRDGRIRELEAALREAGKDTERLDWLEDYACAGSVLWRGIEDLGWVVLPNMGGKTARQAIDAAREAIAKEPNPAIIGERI